MTKRVCKKCHHVEYECIEWCDVVLFSPDDNGNHESLEDMSYQIEIGNKSLTVEHVYDQYPILCCNGKCEYE